MDPKLAKEVKKTQDLLGPFITRPFITRPLLEKNLAKPPFRFLHDIVTSVIETTGFMKGIFTEEELNSKADFSVDAKRMFLNKLIITAMEATGESTDVRPSKILAGKEPEKTNILLQIIARGIKLEKEAGKGKAKEEKVPEKVTSKARPPADQPVATNSRSKPLTTEKSGTKSHASEKLPDKMPSTEKYAPTTKKATPEKLAPKIPLVKKPVIIKPVSESNKTKNPNDEKHKSTFPSVDKDAIDGSKVEVVERPPTRRRPSTRGPIEENDSVDAQSSEIQSTEEAQMSASVGKKSTEDRIEIQKTLSSIKIPVKNEIQPTEIGLSRKRQSASVKGYSKPSTPAPVVLKPSSSKVLSAPSDKEEKNTVPYEGRGNGGNQADEPFNELELEMMSDEDFFKDPEPGPPTSFLIKPPKEHIFSKVKTVAADNVEAPVMSIVEINNSEETASFEKEVPTERPVIASRQSESSLNDEPELLAVKASEESLPIEIPLSVKIPFSRPSTARRAPPTRRAALIHSTANDVVAVKSREPVGTVPNVILDSTADEVDYDAFVVAETVQKDDNFVRESFGTLSTVHKIHFDMPPPENRGCLVDQILTTQKELESSRVQSYLGVIDSDRQKQKQMSGDNYVDEIERIKSMIQMTARNVNPVTKLLDYVPEDAQTIETELQSYRAETRRLTRQIELTRIEADKSLEPLRKERERTETEIKQKEEDILRTKINILKLEERIGKVLSGLDSVISPNPENLRHILPPPDEVMKMVNGNYTKNPNPVYNSSGNSYFGSNIANIIGGTNTSSTGDTRFGNLGLKHSEVGGGELKSGDYAVPQPQQCSFWTL